MVGASFHTVKNLINNLNGVSNGQTNFNPYDSNNQTNFNPLIGKISNIPNPFQKLLNKYMNFNPHH